MLRRCCDMEVQHYNGERRKNTDTNQIGTLKRCDLPCIRRHPLDQLQIRNTLHKGPEKCGRPARPSVMIRDRPEFSA